MIDIKLDIDKNGKPQLLIKHHDRCDSLEQKLLGQLLKEIQENGINIGHGSGYLECGTDKSWETYILQAKDK